MTATERAEFVAARAGSIGGSSIGSLLSNMLDVEYGCQRSLWAELSGIPTDHPEADDETELMTLGNICEPVVAQAYSDQTGRRVESVPLKKHETILHLHVNADRLIYPGPGDTRDTPGVLEIKAVGREMMRKIHESGLPLDYILQLNHGMLVHGLTWGAFAVGTREDLMPLIAIKLTALLAGDPLPRMPRSPKILHFEMERDEEICAAIEYHAPRFWATVGDESQAPPRMEPEDPRCGRCTRRNWCQGAAIMEGIEPEAHIPQRPDLSPLVEEYQANSSLLEQCEALVKETEDRFREVLDKTTAVKVLVDGKWKNVIYRPRNGAERMDGRGMSVQYDTIRRACIEACVPGAELIPPSTVFARHGCKSRPLLLAALLPKKPKAKGEVPENDED